MAYITYRRCDYCGKEEGNPKWGQFITPDGLTLDVCGDCVPRRKDQ